MIPRSHVRGTVSDPESRVLVLFIGTTDLGHKNSLFGHKIFFLVTRFILGPKRSVTGDKIYFFGEEENQTSH